MPYHSIRYHTISCHIMSYHSITFRGTTCLVILLLIWSLQKRMEGKFRRGVVHGRATYYLDNGTRYRHCHRHRHRLRHRFDLFRFMGLFRKGVPHGRAVVIAEDGSQVKVCNIAFLISFREGGKKNCEKAVRLTACVDPLFFLWRLPLLFSCFSIY